MNGLGWTDQQASILTRDAQEISTQARWQMVEDHYQVSLDIDSRANLITALQEAMVAAQQDYQDYQQKQQDYQTQALQEAERRKLTEGSYFLGWGQWILDGMKSIFDSTAEQLIKKYATRAGASKYNHRIIPAINRIADATGISIIG